MYDMTQYMGNPFVKPEDLVASSRREKIVAYHISEFGRPVLEFASGYQLSLNKTNVKTLIQGTSIDGSSWIGREVELIAGETKVNGQLRPSVVLRVIPEGGDSIPF